MVVVCTTNLYLYLSILKLPRNTSLSLTSPSPGDGARKRMARTAAAGAWPLGQWEAMARYVSFIPQDSTDGAMYRAVLAVHKDQYALAYR